MEFRLGFRITLVLVVLALTLSGERVEAQRAGMIIKIEYFYMSSGRAYNNCVTEPPCVYLCQDVKTFTMTWPLSWIPRPVSEKRILRRSGNGWPTL